MNDILVLDTSVVDLNFSPEFARAVEDKQIAEQRAQRAVYITQEAEQQAQAEVNRAKGKAEAQRLLAETLKEQGGGKSPPSLPIGTTKWTSHPPSKPPDPVF